MSTRTRSNGFWLKVAGVVVATLLSATVIASAGVLWSHHARIAQGETRDAGVKDRLDRIEGKLDTLLARP